jgi:GTP-binding protein
MADANEPTPIDMMFRRPWHFVLSAPSLETLPPADRLEVAFAGRSNVGKSSLINALVGQHGLARASNTPGRTQELNFFKPDGVRLYLVDMPGYGYAKAPKDKVDAWTEMVKDFLRGRTTLRRVFLLIDARHGVKANDSSIMSLLDEAAVSFQVVLTKIDKISQAAAGKVLDATAAEIKTHPAAFPEIIATSSERRDGIEQLRSVIAELAVNHAS